MKWISESFVSRARRGQRGQVLPLVALMLLALLGFVGLVTDVGRIYVSFRELQASTDAAALAGAEALPASSPTAISQATLYSGLTGDKNANPNLPGVAMVSAYPELLCLENTPFNYASGCTSKGSCQGTPCAGLPQGANAIRVSQKVTVPLYIAAIFGTKSVNLVATATAAMKGAPLVPYNVAIVVDTTASMSQTDSGTTDCHGSRISCALQGVQVLLSELSPCTTGLSTCGSAAPVDTVSLFTFPAVTSTTPDTCGGGSVSTQPYTYPASPGTYQIVNFSNGYRAGDGSLLTSSSPVVGAVGTTASNPTTGTTTKAGCMQNPGGQATYYAQVIYQAQAALLAQPQTGRQNALIILSDGDATSTCSAYNATTGICTSGPMTGACTGFGTNPSSTNCPSSATAGKYESSYYQCQQAITAAKAATAAGTTVYTVAYGAESSGCLSDNTQCTSTTGSGSKNCVPHGIPTVSSISPCSTMESMASNPTTFFSDYTATGGTSSCVSASQPVTSLDDIFTQIAGSLTVSRLVPDSVQ
jgi:putative Flp pilus-assembly TadE/G-like protein